MPSQQRPRTALPLILLEQGEVEVVGRMPWSSNATFLARVRLGDEEMGAVYKPGRGERELWDFPGGLYRREVAAWVLSEALGWGIVPETVIADGPFGEGSLQRFVPYAISEHYFTLLEHPEYLTALRTIAVFDLVANNADRKSGHCLLGDDGRIWSVDHGLCFHAHPKLRTVMWDFSGEPIPDGLLADVARVAASPPPALVGVLDPEEIDALCARCARIARRGTFPAPGSGRPYPWPLV